MHMSQAHITCVPNSAMTAGTTSSPSPLSPQPPDPFLDPDGYYQFLDNLVSEHHMAEGQNDSTNVIEHTTLDTDETFPNPDNDDDNNFDGHEPFTMESDDEESTDHVLCSGVFSGVPLVSPLGFTPRHVPSSSANPDGAIDTSLREKYRQYTDSRHGSAPINAQYIAQVNLLVLLNKVKAPIYLYDEIWEWTNHSATAGVNFLDIAPKRTSVISDIRKRFDMKETVPQDAKVTLPLSRAVVTLPVHHFKNVLYSLLSNESLMHEKNLLFPNDGDPFSEPVPFNKRDSNFIVSDIIHGDAYFHAYERLCKGKPLKVLCSILIFIDKTHIDAHGRLTLEPVSMTLGLFRKECRRRPEFWSPIGYILNQSNFTAASSATDRLQDYHFQLRVILHSLISVQNEFEGGIAWRLRINRKDHDVHLRCPIHFVVGDTEGHDRFCGKFLSRTRNVKCLCRYCDCPTAETSITSRRIVLTKASGIARRVARDDKEGLQNLSYHCIQNAFTGAVFSDDV